MKLSLNWLKDFIQIDKTPDELGYILTMAGLEVEGVEKMEAIPGGLEGIVIGEVLECVPHPNADKLRLTKVDIGDGEPKAIVCGAPNVAQGQKVIVATVGATLYPTEGEPFKIKRSKIRGEESVGMICAEDEIGLGKSHDGIMVLNTDLPNGTPAAQYFNIAPDYRLEIGLTPNRADAASHYGTARDLKVLLGKPLTFPDLSGFKPARTNGGVQVVVENSAACPRYSGVTIEGVTVQESPAWLQERLRAIGLSPINNIVDITNFVLHGLGQPLHAFDADKIKGNKVVVKNLPEGTPFTTLDEVERKLAGSDLMICNAQEGMCIAGVFGGLASGVTENTKRVFIESAYFHPDHVRRTAMHHGLKTDAAFRFERGTDPNMTVKAAKYAALLIQQIAGGEIVSDIVDIYPQPIANFTVKAKYKNIDRLIGKSLDRALIKNILQGLEMEILEETAEGLTLSVPPYRVDVQREADITEEILRIYGFNSIEINEHLSSDYLALFPAKDKDKLRYEVSTLLASSGMNEIYTNSLTKDSYLEGFSSYSADGNVEILNKLSQDLGVMRQSMVFSGLEAVAYNVNRKQKDVKLFEFGRTYHKVNGKYEENEWLVLLVSGNKQPESWLAPAQKAEFHTLAGLVHRVLARLGFAGYTTNDAALDVFQYGIQYEKDGKVPVKMGMLKDAACKKVGLKQQVFYAELDWAYFVQQGQKPVIYQEIPKFPEVRRDLSLVLDKGVRFDQVRDLAMKTERKLLRDFNAFSVYEGDNLGEGKKSYAVSFILQDKESTLTDKAIDKTMERLQQVFEKELGAVIRK